MTLGWAIASVGLATLGAGMVHAGIEPVWTGWVCFGVGLLIGARGVK
jgi:hypothetical protein